jgi:hypothetical protein
MSLKWSADGEAANECVLDAGKAACAAAGGVCVVVRDGYYIVQAICLVLGLVTVVGYIIPRAKELQGTSPCLRQDEKGLTNGYRAATGEVEVVKGHITWP